MKRIIASMVAFCMALCSYADTVSQNMAAETARNFFASNSTRSSSVLLTMVWDGRDATTRAGEEPAFYVFNNASGGFVIISGEDAARPVLGFSETGSFKVGGMPEQIRGWFDFYKAQIASLRKGNAARTAKADELWSNVSRGDVRRATQVTLNTPTWGQDRPFNSFLPKVDNQQSVTGCVCTATCEVMYHHKWPSQGHGTLPDYEYETDKGRQRTQNGHLLSATYNWNTMLKVYGYQYSSDEGNQVAQLMFDVGVMLKSSYNGADGYSTYGTAAYDQDVIPALVRYMDYDSSAVLLYREQYSDSRWAAMMRAEIDAGRPMIYGGDGDDGGHCFVVDGYKANDYFYVNWGWNGDSNGWFAISSFIADGYDFRYDQDCIFGLKKNEGGAGRIMLYHYDNTGKAGIYLKSGTVGTSYFQMGVSGVYNFGSDTVNTDYAFVLTDRNGNIKESVSAPDGGKLGPEYGFETYDNCKLSATAAKNLQIGDNIIYCFRNAKGQWEKIPMYETCRGVDAYAVYHVPFIEVNAAATYNAGDLLPLRLININKAPTSTKWYMDGTLVKDSDVILKAGEHTIKCVAKFSDRSETLIQKITVR